MSSRTMPGGARTFIRARPLAAGLLPALLAVLLLPLQAGAAPNGYGVITEYATSPVSGPAGIITGPDGKIWYAGSSTDTVVRVDPATGATMQSVSTLLGGSSGCMPVGLTIGPDHNLWTACFVGNYLVRITTAGVATQYLLPAGSAPWALTPGPDGALWFTEEGTGKIGRLDMSSFALSEFPLATGAGAKPRGIAAGSDGRLWFTEQGANVIGKVTTGGFVTEYATPTPNSAPFDIAMGPDDHLYYTELLGDRIGKIAMDGAQVEFPVPTVSNLPHLINVGPDGNLWFTYFGTGNKIGSMTPGGTFQDFSPPTPLSHPFGITTGPDGNVWFTESGGFKIAKVGARHNVLVLDHTAIGFGDVAAGSVAPAQRVTLTNTGPDPVPPFTPVVPGSVVGKFFFSAETCSAAPIASGGSCYADIQFKAVGLLGNATGSVVFDTSSGAPDEQILTVALAANAIGAACASTAISTDLASPQNVGATVTLNASSAGCPNVSPLYRFWVRDTSAVWQIVQDFSTATSFAWNTSTWGQGTFLIGVWVKDANSTNNYDAYAFGTFTLSVPTCSSTNVSSDLASPQVVGATVNFTASSLGCPSPLYQWWVRDTDGNWAIVPGHDFAHSSTTFAWNTSALIEGTYQVGVWAKQLLSANSYDAFAFVTYTLTISHCTAVNLGTSVTSPHATGAAITLTPTVTGCASPQYRFYVRDSSAAWHIVQDFGVGSTYSWGPSSPVSTSNAGTYLLGLWARQAGSANTYDAFSFITFSLTSGTTCSVNIAADKTSPQSLGTTATWTATPNNCPSLPLSYQFWVNPPGGSWGIVQPFSLTTTYAWTGGTAGTYQVGVWIKEAGSPTLAYDNFAFTTFTLTPANPVQMCGSVGVTPAVASPQMVGTTVNFTASANGCGSPQYQWWVRDTSANWAIVQDFAHSSPTLAWNTSGLLPGTYLVGVWARQLNSSSAYEAYSFITYTRTLPAGQVCSSVGISSSVPSPQPRGTNVVFLAAAAGCNTPEYRYFIAPPGQPFGEIQSYGVNNRFIWITSALVPGPYQIGVWARQQGSTAAYEAFAIVTFQIQPAGTPCTTLSLFPTNGSSANDITSQPPQPAGTTITWTASAGGCASAEYAFSIRPPTTFSYPLPYTLVQPYSSAPTYVWFTAGLPKGTYGFLVSARVAGSSSVFDVIAVASFEIV